MQAPFADFAIPSPLYLAILLAGTVLVAALLYAIRPPVNQRVVLAFLPWIVSGAALHVFHQIGEIYAVEIYPPLFEPFFAAPAVYLTTFVGMGTIWVASTMFTGDVRQADRTASYLGWVGAGVMIALLGLIVWQGLDPLVGPLQPIVPTLTVIVAMVLSFVLYIMLGAWRAYVIAEARVSGFLVIFSHVLDGVSTAVGVDVLGTGERSAIPARIIEFAGTLPTAEVMGSGWLFVVFKAIVAIAIVYVFADYVSEEPTRGNLFFAVVVAVGLGPAVNNLLLFFLGG